LTTFTYIKQERPIKNRQSIENTEGAIKNRQSIENTEGVIKDRQSIENTEGGGVALTSPSLHTERISEYKINYPPPKFLTATIFLHAHLQVVYYNCVKFHKNPISCLGGVVLTRYMPSFFS
jgi:hypothetical protein